MEIQLRQPEGLSQFTDRIRTQFAETRTLSISPSELTVGPNDTVQAGGEELLIDQVVPELARLSGLPASLFDDNRANSFDAEERRFLLDRRKEKLPAELTFYTRGDQVDAVADAGLPTPNWENVVDVITNTLPKGLVVGNVKVDASSMVSRQGFTLSLFTERIRSEPRRGDFLNGGVQVSYALTSPPRVSCFMRRLACTNGMVSHVCLDSKKRGSANVRGRYAAQVRRRRGVVVNLDPLAGLLRSAWAQVSGKLEAQQSLLEEKVGDLDALFREWRSRLRLNEKLWSQVKLAINADELEPTGTLFDLTNALSRIATHGPASDDVTLSTRQRNALMRGAGELSQLGVRRCSGCGLFVASNAS